MRAALVVPGEPERAGVAEVPDPEAGAGELLVDGLLVGVCGTDVEIVRDGFGTPPDGRDELVLFHESLGRVVSAPPDSGFAEGDLVVGVVRRPDPEPCRACAAGDWDYCHNGRYTERGIEGLDGYGSTRWTVPAAFAIKLDPALGDAGVLTEPASVVAKAWEQAELIGRRAHLEMRSALITGAGPIGLLAALLAVQRGMDVHVLDRATSGAKPDLVRALGATYHSSPDDLDEDVDVAIECTGVPELVLDVAGRASVTVLAGITGDPGRVEFESGALLDSIVLGNRAVVGSVNASLRHYEAAAAALAAADPRWLNGLITRRVPLSRFTEAFDRSSDDVKVVVDLTA
ncbi:glucose 1-dehydrogenase [Umezawaea beigongshangensis]|uniref:glucose 1-dehydrogenase n=1 Tax=Umezawaea beigongshangensis TaxID=2780383 RepID=UPI0018F20217|nr:glucose 1-dehydrogenase [Umezawaea beigongshangensis]